MKVGIVGSALARIVKAILHDERAIMTVCTPKDEVAGCGT